MLQQLILRFILRFAGSETSDVHISQVPQLVFSSSVYHLFASRDPVQNFVWSTQCWRLKRLIQRSLHAISWFSTRSVAPTPTRTAQLQSLFFMSA